MISEETKRCGGCKQDKTLSEFRKRPNGKLQSYCGLCQNKSNNRYRMLLMNDRRAYRQYRHRQNESNKKHWKKMEREFGIKLYIPMQERFVAIMKLV